MRQAGSVCPLWTGSQMGGWGLGSAAERGQLVGVTARKVDLPQDGGVTSGTGGCDKRSSALADRDEASFLSVLSVSLICCPICLSGYSHPSVLFVSQAVLGADDSLGAGRHEITGDITASRGIDETSSSVLRLSPSPDNGLWGLSRRRLDGLQEHPLLVVLLRARWGGVPVEGALGSAQRLQKPSTGMFEQAKQSIQAGLLLRKRFGGMSSVSGEEFHRLLYRCIVSAPVRVMHPA